VDLPYSHVINYLKILDLVFEDDVAQRCWSILNDMYVSYFCNPLSVLYLSERENREREKKRH
jgi:hypothetical protein